MHKIYKNWAATHSGIENNYFMLSSTHNIDFMAPFNTIQIKNILG